MASPTRNTPFALMKASFELVLRINGTLLEAQRRWLEIGARCADESIDLTEADTDEIAHADGWARLRELPAAFGSEWLDASTTYVQRTIETAMTNHANFVAGLQNALMLWRDECAEALGGNAAPARPSASLDALPVRMLPCAQAKQAQAPAATSPRTKPRTRRRS